MGQTALVIDDDEMVADVVRIALEAKGFQVVHAPTAEAALTVIRDTTPAVILLDGSLPDAGTWTLLETIRGDGDKPPVPVVVMTARAMPADQVRAYNMGATASLSKPVLADEVVETVTQLLAGA